MTQAKRLQVGWLGPSRNEFYCRPLPELEPHKLRTLAQRIFLLQGVNASRVEVDETNVRLIKLTLMPAAGEPTRLGNLVDAIARTCGSDPAATEYITSEEGGWWGASGFVDRDYWLLGPNGGRS